jgi:DNA invertase Pin-like site-specific DNA recombinase
MAPESRDALSVVIYASKSTEDVHESVPGQLAKTRERIDAEGGRTVCHEFSEENVSGYSKSRGPALEAAIAAAKTLAGAEGKSELWVFHSARLARGSGRKNEARSLGEVFHDCKRHGVTLRSVQDDPYVTDEAFVGMASKMANKYSADLSGYTKAGMKRRAARGLYTGRRPYGYKLADGLLEIVASEEAIVCRIFREFVAGRSQVAIAAGLHAEGFRTMTGRDWRQAQISGIVHRAELYAGNLPYDGEVYEGQHEAIIDLATRGRVNELLAANGPSKGRGRPPRGHHLFRGRMLRCGLCGYAMSPRTKTKPYWQEYYVCSNPYCDRGAVKRAEVDESVFDYFTEAGLDLEATKAALQEAHDRRLAEVRGALADAEREAQKAKDRLARVKRDYQDGKLDADDWREFKTELTAERKAADAEVLRLREQADDVEGWSDLKDAEAETLERLTEIRQAIAGEVRDAEGLDAVRAALMRLFREFVYSVEDSEAVITPKRRVVIDFDFTDDDAPKVELRPSRVPLELAGNKNSEGSGSL